ncbi:MAG: hypothetical protein KBF93_26665 [Leptospiraceae bacterium]|nr:hypothetical protein [Leptospiraceae bacterium]
MNFKKIKYSLELLKNKTEIVTSPALDAGETHLFPNFLATLFIMLFVLQFSNCESKSSDDEEKLRAAAGMIINRLTGTTSSTGLTTGNVGSGCSSSNPSFSSLSSAGANSNCARSGCHVGSSPQNGLDMSSYSSVISKVSPNNPNGSVLYQKVNGGSMQIYTTSAINTAIFCWIQGGALP